MNHIEEKLQQFLKKTIVSDITLTSNTLNSYNIRYNEPQHLVGTLFEKGSLNHVPNFQDDSVGVVLLLLVCIILQESALTPIPSWQRNQIILTKNLLG